MKEWAVMKSFEKSWLDGRQVSLAIAGQLRRIGEMQGQAEYYEFPTIHMEETSRSIAAEEASAATERLEKFSDSNETRNYRRLRLEVQEYSPRFTLTSGEVLRLHKELFQDSVRSGGSFKEEMTREAVKHLCTGYNSVCGYEMDALLSIGAFFLDFHCIQPFLEGNVRVADLLAIRLLTSQGYSMNRFVSLEKHIEATRRDYYDAIQMSSLGWNEGAHDLTFWWSYWLTIIESLYDEFAKQALALQVRRGIKTSLVLAAITDAKQEFTIREIQQSLPGVGIELVRKIFKAEQIAGKLKCLGRGPNAVWKRIKTRPARRKKAICLECKE